MPAHSDAGQLRKRVSALLADPERRCELVARHRDQVWRADVHRHDETFMREWRRLAAAG